MVTSASNEFKRLRIENSLPQPNPIQTPSQNEISELKKRANVRQGEGICRRKIDPNAECDLRCL